MGQVKWKQMLIALAVGFVPTAISYTLGWWWGGTIFALLTVLVIFFLAPAKWYALFFTVYVIIVIWVVSGALIESVLPVEWRIGQAWRDMIAGAIGLLIGAVPVLFFWFVVLAVSVTWILALTKSLDIPWWKAFKYVAQRTFQVYRSFILVENGEIRFEKPPSPLADLGGPKLLIVGVGNVCVLESGGKVTRIVGPGMYNLGQFEYLKKPLDGKGIMDLRPQFAGDWAEDVRTKDGIPLKIKVGEFFQLEPTHVTDARPESHFPGGDATTPVLGAPEHPVYEAIIRKAVFNIPQGGWKSGWFPGDPITRLRDVVATYTLDEIFALDRYAEKLTPDERAIKEIEDEIKRRFNPVGGGVWFKGIDIREISMPEEVEKEVLRKWTERVERELKIEGARAESEALIQVSEGRARSLERLEKVRLYARANTAKLIGGLVDALSGIKQEHIALSFVSVVQELTNRIGQDETVAMRYIEAMQTIVQSEGPKSFVITPPTPAPGFMPSPPSPTLQAGDIIKKRLKGDKEE